MNITRSSLLVTILVVAAPACGNRLLVGEGPDGGPPPMGTAGTSGTAGVTGTAGSSVSGTGAAGTNVAVTGTAGFTGAAGVSGAGGTGVFFPDTTNRPLRITGTEALSRLAAVLWKSLPGEPLAEPPAVLFNQTYDLFDPIRLALGDPRARVGLGAFYRWWLDLDRLRNELNPDQALAKDPTVFPSFSAALAVDMATETETFAVNVTLDNERYQTLMTAPFTFANERLAAIYGVAGHAGLSTFQRIDLDPQQRAGLLTQPSLQALASFAKRTSPSRRGTEILTRFLCQTIPQAPAGIPEPPPIMPGTTVRHWLEEVVASSNCRICHNLFDPLGLEFETFDAIGRWRTIDNGAPVDVSGLEIQRLTPSRVVTGPVELAKALANDDLAQQCIVRQFLAYVLGRPLTKADDTSVAQAVATFRAGGFKLHGLIIGVLTTDAFLAP